MCVRDFDISVSVYALRKLWFYFEHFSYKPYQTGVTLNKRRHERESLLPRRL